MIDPTDPRISLVLSIQARQLVSLLKSQIELLSALDEDAAGRYSLLLDALEKEATRLNVVTLTHQ